MQREEVKGYLGSGLVFCLGYFRIICQGVTTSVSAFLPFLFSAPGAIMGMSS